MQAPKNGFFYVLDRATGELLSAKPYVTINWAKEVDMKTGRPVENPEARALDPAKMFMQQPGPLGGHNWQPMSYDPLTGLVYIPAQESAFPYLADAGFKYLPGGAWNLGMLPLPTDRSAGDYAGDAAGLGSGEASGPVEGAVCELLEWRRAVYGGWAGV